MGTRSAGVNPVVVQKVLGHRDVSMTVERYGHFAPSFALREIEKLRLRPATRRVADKPVDESAGDSKAPTASPEIVSAAEALERAGDGGRTRDPRLGKPMLYH